MPRMVSLALSFVGGRWDRLAFVPPGDGMRDAGDGGRTLPPTGLFEERTDDDDPTTPAPPTLLDATGFAPAAAAADDVPDASPPPVDDPRFLDVFMRLRMLTSLLATRLFLPLPPLAMLVPPPPTRGGVALWLFPLFLTSDDDMGDGDLVDDDLVIVFTGVLLLLLLLSLLTLLFKDDDDDDEDVSGPLTFIGDGDRRSLVPPPGESERKFVARRAILIYDISIIPLRDGPPIPPPLAPRPLLNVRLLFRRFVLSPGLTIPNFAFFSRLL
jgi:hypothetical protein